jgi:hypothetical protein
MTELSGALEGIGLSPLIKFLSDIHVNGALSLEEAPFTGKLYFDHGQVRGARFGTDEGSVAVEGIALTLRDGRFAFTSASTDPETVNLSYEGDGIIQELDRLAGEADRYGRLIPPMSATPVPKRSSGSEEDESVMLDRGSVQLLLNCNGRATVADLVQSGSKLSTLKRLARLVELGLIECQPADRPRPPAPRPEADANSPRQSTPAWSPQPASAEPTLHSGANLASVSQDGTRWKWRRGQ